MRHPTDEQFVLYHYGELDQAEGAAFRSHLGECEGCRERLATLERELAAVRPVSIPERPTDYGARVWARLQPRLAEERARASKAASWWSFGAVTLRPFAYAAGLAVLVVAAFVAGRFWAPAPSPGQVAGGTPVSSTPSTTAGSEPDLAGAPGGAADPTDAAMAAARVRERILALEVGEHLERSQAALLEVMNAPDEDDGAIDLSADQERVRELVAENRLYRLAAIDAGESAMAAVLDELERALVEIANGPSRVSGTEFERVRGDIDEQGLIFKVGILGETLRQRQAKGSSI